jgi:hypothetical protein
MHRELVATQFSLTHLAMEQHLVMAKTQETDQTTPHR